MLAWLRLPSQVALLSSGEVEGEYLPCRERVCVRVLVCMYLRVL